MTVQPIASGSPPPWTDGLSFRERAIVALTSLLVRAHPADRIDYPRLQDEVRRRLARWNRPQTANRTAVEGPRPV